MQTKYPFKYYAIPAIGGFLFLFLFIMVRLYLFGGNEQLSILILILKLTGFFASYQLVLGSMNVPFFERFCPKTPRFDCHRVIESPAAKILGFIHAADLGVLYFGATSFLLIFTAFSDIFYYAMVFMGVLNILTLPYTVFSITYQAFKVKKWCAMCLIVQLIFWLEFSQFYKFIFGNPIIFRLTLKFATTVVLCFSITLFLWILVRYLLDRAYGDIGVRSKH